MSAPNGAKLEVMLTIDGDKWNELIAQGYSDADLQKSIEKSITFKDTISGAIASPPVIDVISADLRKYY
jgi:hypothetical protein